ncbi:hypothetical protein TNCV_134811 [Trichonephila clavipes]|nr:hypothetical protein TNCV_134811 [Trichonephila clavipes]
MVDNKTHSSKLQQPRAEVRENGIWRIQYNLELQSKYREPNIIKVIKTSQIRWLEHVFRYSDENPVKEITSRAPEGKRKRGRPRENKAMDKVERLGS